MYLAYFSWENALARRITFPVAHEKQRENPGLKRLIENLTHLACKARRGERLLQKMTRDLSAVRQRAFVGVTRNK